MNTQQRYAGIVKWYDPKKGYGFIITLKGDELFFHLRGLVDANNTPKEGDIVDYVIVPGRKKHELAADKVKIN